MDRPGVHSIVSMAVAITLFSGIISITIPNSLLTTFGVLLVIFGLMGLMPVVLIGLTDDPGEFLDFL